MGIAQAWRVPRVSRDPCRGPAASPPAKLWPPGPADPMIASVALKESGIGRGTRKGNRRVSHQRTGRREVRPAAVGHQGMRCAGSRCGGGSGGGSSPNMPLSGPATLTPTESTTLHGERGAAWHVQIARLAQPERPNLCLQPRWQRALQCRACVSPVASRRPASPFPPAPSRRGSKPWPGRRAASADNAHSRHRAECGLPADRRCVARRMGSLARREGIRRSARHPPLWRAPRNPLSGRLHAS